MATDDITEEVAISMRAANHEEDVDLYEGGYFDAASDAIQAIEDAGFKVVKA